MAVEFCTPAEIEDHLETLKFLFLCLPDTVPNGSQFYNFSHFVPDPDKVEDFGGEDRAGLILICATASRSRHSFGQYKFRSGINTTPP